MKMKNTIQFRLTIVSISFIALIIAISWLLYHRSSFVWFEAKAEKSLESLYQQVNELFLDTDVSDDELAVGFEGLNNPLNAIIVVSDGESKIYTTTNEKSMMFDSLNAMTKLIQNPSYLENGKNYVIEIHQDDRMQTGYYDLTGYLSNGYMIVIRTSMDSINTSARFTNRTFLYFSLAILVLAAIVISCISRYFSKPIHDMAIVAKRMSNLDFDAKVTVKSKDEVGELGESMNVLSTKLEHTISELKTANSALHHDIEQKTQIDEMRKEFLSHVSHELKTPIALIQGYAEGLNENISDDPESRAFYCEVIMDEASKMNKLVKNLLTLNQLESGKDAPVMERFDIVSLIRGVLGSMNIMIEQKEATVIFEETEPVYVWADEFKIEEVVTNYTSNALNHLDGEHKIEIKVLRESDCVKVTVFNTGTPIPEEDLPNLWNKFYKVDKARTREYGGSGIGLSIVKAIIEGMNQKYGVCNYDNGVEFWFTLDCRQ